MANQVSNTRRNILKGLPVAAVAGLVAVPAQASTQTYTVQQYVEDMKAADAPFMFGPGALVQSLNDVDWDKYETAFDKASRCGISNRDIHSYLKSVDTVWNN